MLLIKRDWREHVLEHFAFFIGWMTIDYDEALAAEQYLKDKTEAVEAQMVSSPASETDNSMSVSYEGDSEGGER